MRQTQSPCVADALFGTKSVTVNGKTVGIARLCDAIAAVQARDLSGDDRIKTALLAKVEENNFIPASMRDNYADALLKEYRAVVQQSPRDVDR